jgi:c-di-GMP-binding flagellar brake protein YcgR
VGEKVWLELELPDQQTAPVRCLGRVVRLFDGDCDERQAAFEFENLSGREQDRIIAFCLAEQRKLLREKVRIRHC